jgi:hypothetical protein
MSQPNNHVVVTLRIPKVIAQLIAFAQAIVMAMTNNKVLFPTPSPALVQVTADTNSLVSAQTTVASRIKGAVAIRDEKRLIVVSDLHQLEAYVQQLVNLNPDQAISIAEAAGMGVRKPKAATQKSPITAIQVVSGSVKLVAKAALGGRSNEWQVSTDGKTWTSAPPSTKAKTTVTGLQTGVLTYFRHRAVTKAGATDWTQPVSMLVS